MRGDALVCVCVTSLPMGHINATDVAQTAHQNLLRSQGGELGQLDDVLAYRQPVPRARRWRAVMIDDLVVLEAVARTVVEAQADTEGSALLRSALLAYRGAGLIPKESKTYEKQIMFDALGATVNGDVGLVAPKAELQAQLLALVGQMAHARVATLDAASISVALLGYSCMYRREAFSLLDHSFHFVPKLRKVPSKRARLPDSVRDEMVSLTLLSPLLCSDLRASVHDELMFVDARGGKCGRRPQGGYCAAQLPQECMDELWRRRVRRGGAAHLASTHDVMLDQYRDMLRAGGYDEAEVQELLPSVDDDLTLDRRWVGELAHALRPEADCDAQAATCLGDAFRFELPDEHINCGEYRAKRVGVRRQLRRGRCNRRFLVGSDSNVTIGAGVKGRSKSKKLMRLQRQESAENLFANVYVGLLPVDTLDNPGDEPSRSKPLRERRADEPVAGWARRFLEGDVAAIDAVVDGDMRTTLLFAAGQSPGPAVDREREWHVPAANFCGSSLPEPTTQSGRAARSASHAPPPEATDGEARNPGPPRRQGQRDADVDFRVGGHELPTTKRRAALFAEFVAFARQRGIEVEAVLEGSDVRPIVKLLRDRGHDMYHGGRARGDFKDTILAVADRRDDWRRLLPSAWKIEARWHALEPTEHHAPCPVELARAVSCAAILRKQYRFAALTLLAFAAALRPCEFTRVALNGCLFPRGVDSYFFVIIGRLAGTKQPKTAKRGGGHEQHVRVTAPVVVAFIQWLRASSLDQGRVWRHNQEAYSSCWRVALAEFGVPATAREGFTPSSLRAGAASAMYNAGSQLDDIRWVLRHVNQGSLESYVQELPATMLRAAISEAAWQKVLRFSGGLDAAVQECIGFEP